MNHTALQVSRKHGSRQKGCFSFFQNNFSENILAKLIKIGSKTDGIGARDKGGEDSRESNG